jgi:phosphatidylserine/phosphatidylglycerophosphate/cardiolipin synthase-like enzyme
MKKIYLSAIGICAIFLSENLNAQQNVLNYIKVYFSQPVDNSYSNTGVNATYLNNTIFDTLAAYINRAKYSVDLAQYEYETWSGDPIATAVNNAYSRGVKVRFIQDGSYASKNTGVKLLNASIPVIASPTTSSYGIMHNKFVIVDEYSPDSTQSFVLTGSADWDATMSSHDYNNMIVFQSKVLARAYTHEFDIMWGDTTHGGASNATASKFGPYKPNSGTHHFTIGGSLVELYFSPSDSTNNHIVKTIKSSKTELYCGMNAFSDTSDAWDIVYQKGANVYATAILDQYSSGTYTTYTSILPKGLGSNFVGYVNANYLYHNKYVITDPSSPCYDPKVLTGSHNWTFSANTKNDENTVIVHNDTIANLYLQAFASDFKTIGGTALTKQQTCPNGINSIDAYPSQVNVFPNPFNGSTTLNYTLASDQKITIGIYNVMGQKVSLLVDGKMLEAGVHTYTINTCVAGVYIIRIQEGEKMYVRKIVSVQ